MPGPRSTSSSLRTPTIWDVRERLRQRYSRLSPASREAIEQAIEAVQTLYDLGVCKDSHRLYSCSQLIKRIEYLAKRHAA